MPPTACPNTAASGCRCPEHHPGLLATSHPDRLPALAEYLDRLRPDPPQVVIELVHVSGPSCSGTLTCPCGKCEQERADRRRRPAQLVRQPWHVRPSRRAA